MAKILGISGRKSAGKDTTSQYIQKVMLEKWCLLQMAQYSFADPLKEFCINVLGLKHEQCYGTDEQKNTLTQLKWENMPIYWHGEIKPIADFCKEPKAGYMTAREVLQYFGTEVCRKLNPNCWVQATIKKSLDSNLSHVIIADVRFPEEIDGIHKVGGKVIRLLRNPYNDKHPSETALDSYPLDIYDAVIDNTNMSIEECGEEVMKYLGRCDWI